MSQRSHTRLISGGGRHRRGKAAAAVVLTPFLDHSVTLASTGAANSVRFPSPLWGGDRGGGLCWRTRVDQQQRPPSPTLPHKGGGSRPVVLRRCASTSLEHSARSSRPCGRGRVAAGAERRELCRLHRRPPPPCGWWPTSPPRRRSG